MKLLSIRQVVVKIETFFFKILLCVVIMKDL
jgi:hypothetical protein